MDHLEYCIVALDAQLTAWLAAGLRRFPPPDARQRGQGLVEYMAIIFVVSLLILGVAKLFGTAITALTQRVVNELGQLATG